MSLVMMYLPEGTLHVVPPGVPDQQVMTSSASFKGKFPLASGGEILSALDSVLHNVAVSSISVAEVNDTINDRVFSRVLYVCSLYVGTGSNVALGTFVLWLHTKTSGPPPFIPTR
eukprot:m.1586065 g.1586065  ORF g.1586065 m.1586065 type:complete len:115 (+) comp25327_c0_seq9:858-1202(+)